MTMLSVQAAYVGTTDEDHMIFIGNGHVLTLEPPCEGNECWFVYTGMSLQPSWQYRRMDSALDYIGRILSEPY